MAGHIIIPKEVEVRPPNLHLLGELFLDRGLRQMFDIVLLTQLYVIVLLTQLYVIVLLTQLYVIVHLTQLYVILPMHHHAPHVLHVD